MSRMPVLVMLVTVVMFGMPVVVMLVGVIVIEVLVFLLGCLLYTSPSPRDLSTSRMPSSA